jgi:hypothetical protein
MRTEVIPNCQVRQAVFQMDNHRLAWENLQRRRGIEAAARHLPIGCGAASHLIVEQKEVLDRSCGRVEPGRALPRDQTDFEHAILACQRDRFVELGGNRQSDLACGNLRRDRCSKPAKDRQCCDDTDNSSKKRRADVPHASGRKNAHELPCEVLKNCLSWKRLLLESTHYPPEERIGSSPCRCQSFPGTWLASGFVSESRF